MVFNYVSNIYARGVYLFPSVGSCRIDAANNIDTYCLRHSCLRLA